MDRNVRRLCGADGRLRFGRAVVDRGGRYHGSRGSLTDDVGAGQRSDDDRAGAHSATSPRATGSLLQRVPRAPPAFAIAVDIANASSVACYLARPYPEFGWTSTVTIADASGAVVWAPGDSFAGASVSWPGLVVVPGGAYTWSTVGWDGHACTTDATVQLAKGRSL